MVKEEKMIRQLFKLKDSLVADEFTSLGDVKLGAFCVIEKGVVIGKNVTIGDYVKIPEGSVIGNDVVIGSYVRLGKNCKIGNGCVLKIRTTISPNTILEDNVFMGPHSMVLHMSTNGICKPSIIRKNAWVGACALIGPNVTIGKGVLLGAMAFAHKDCPLENGTYLGSPARFIRIRNEGGE